MDRSEGCDFRRLIIAVFCMNLLTLTGCESVPVRPINPNPYDEYQQAQQEFNDARAYLAQVQANKSINAMNESMGNFSGSRTNQGIGALLNGTTALGEADAQQKVDAAQQRLNAAIRNLPQNININVRQSNRPFLP